MGCRHGNTQDVGGIGMAKRKYTGEHIEYLRKIAPGRSSYEITEMFNEKFKMNTSRETIRTLMYRNKIKTGAPKGNPVGYSKLFPSHIKNFINKNYKGNGPKRMTELINKNFGTTYTHNQLKGYYNRQGLNSGVTGHFPKGHTPWNKGMNGLDIGGKETRFKKGHTPYNHLPIGTERINSDGYADIKIAEPNVWLPVHRFLWERENGPIPDGYVVIFGDGDKTNLSLDNLILVSRKQLLGLNQRGLIQNHANLTRTAIKIVDLQYKITEKENM